jgi:plasmid stabilization system protein ParE
VDICTLKKVSQAETDIAAAIVYLGERDPTAAWRFVVELDKVLDRIAEFPEWFPHQRRTENPRYRDVRFAVVRPFGYLIFYQWAGNTVTVLRVLHGSMNEP